MKKINFLLLLTSIVLLIATSCVKGPQGAQGPAGPAGPTGPQGPAGANGNTIYSGSAVPSATIGNTGDFYIDLTTGMFYGPKTSSGWGTGFSLIGPAGPPGPAGTNGNTIYSGTTVPPATTGNVGDFYIDLTTAVFYGPKTSSGWGTGFSLVGLGSNFPTVLNTIVTPAIIDTLQAHGMIINAGLTPPTVSGIYLISPNECLFDNSGYSAAGNIFDDYEYEFTSQSNSNFTITVNYSDKIAGGSDSGSDTTATYLSGSGNSFTIYAQTKGTESGIAYTNLEVISGQIVSGAINNFQYSIYVVSKGSDPNNVLIPVGSTRIFEDQDGVSPVQSTFTFYHGPKTGGLLLRHLKAILLNNKR